MNRLQVWQRLVWREMREGWVISLAAIALPPVLFPQGDRFPHDNPYRGLLYGLGVYGIQLLLVIWGAVRGERKRKSGTFELEHLPVSPKAEWLFSFALPFVASALLGVWSGIFLRNHSVYPVPAGAVDYALSFAVGYYFALIASQWIALLLGIIHLVTGNSFSLSGSYTDIHSMMVTASVALGCAAGSFYYLAQHGRKSRAFRQLASLGIVVLFALIPIPFGPDFRMVFHKSPKVGHVEELHDWDASHDSGPPYWLTIRRDPEKDSRKIIYTNELTGEKRVHEFAPRIEILTVQDKTHVYMLQKRPSSRIINLLLWDIRRDNVTRLISFDSGTVETKDNAWGNISPDGRYILVNMASLIGQGSDTWLVDIKRKRAEIVIPAASFVGWFVFPGETDMVVRWQGEKAIMSGAELREIDLNNFTSRHLDVPFKEAK